MSLFYDLDGVGFLFFFFTCFFTSLKASMYLGWEKEAALVAMVNR